MVEMDRRQFLKVLAVAGTSAALGCSSEAGRNLVPFIIQPEDIVPGNAAWYATTCRECPAGCGMLAKNRDGRVIKVEGNPLHPVSGGKLCPRGQASLHGLYNPDRFKTPLRRNEQGRYQEISWDQAESILVQYVRDNLEGGQNGQISFISRLMTGTLPSLVSNWLKAAGQTDGPFFYEAFSYESLRKADQIVFGFDAIPSYDLANADFILSFGADFLETWLSNVQYALAFKNFHQIGPDGKNPFYYVGPRQSMTAANADRIILVRPGDEYLAALAILQIIEGEGKRTLPGPVRSLINTKEWPLEKIIDYTGLDPAALRDAARKFAAARAPLALASGLSIYPNSLETAVLANLLCRLNPGTAKIMDFSDPQVYSQAARAADMRLLADRMNSGGLKLLLVYRANPVFSLPSSWNIHKSLEKVPLIVSFSSAPDETSSFAHLILPTNTPLESWGEYSPRSSVTGLIQPAMGPVFNTRNLGDILISSGKKLAGENKFPYKNFYELLQSSWSSSSNSKKTAGNENLWTKSLQEGGTWGAQGKAKSSPGIKVSSFVLPTSGPAKQAKQPGFYFTAYPTIQFYDGRNANRAWLQELPDPITQITWGGWVEMHPDTAGKLGVKKGDLLKLSSPYGSLEVPVRPINTVLPDTLAMPLGQGHTDYGRFANGLPASPTTLFGPQINAESGGLAGSGFLISVEPQKKQFAIANTDGSFYQHGRGFIEIVPYPDYRKAILSNAKPKIDIPLPESYRPHKDIYPPHGHKDYRWAMIIDLDRCIGCGACVVACYAENNVALVWKEGILNGREMSWLRIERYFDTETGTARFLPMLCQHCEEAPCESVCPVYAPYHNPEGLNTQVYNRCIGTRFCLQNDPWKVRRFNWFKYTRPSPLDWQLNPDVTVRTKGVMEKCSFCIQRIVDARIRARNEGRKIKDGEFTTACAQTCPTNTLIFGSLLDPESRVSTLINDTRAYQVLGSLNTKPAVIYLKKVIM